MILSGGVGERLWPLSTESRPKQFAELVPDGPLLGLTLRRLAGRPGVGSPIVVTGAAYAHLVREMLTEPGLIISEPEGRNTAPAIMAAALAGLPQDIMVVLPSDHLIADADGFGEAVDLAVGHASEGRLVTFGVEPIRPETGYGYIEKGEEVDGAFQVVRFKEKPDQEEAERLSGDARHLWNSGMFVMRSSDFLAEAEKHCPDILEGVGKAMRDPQGDTLQLGEEFRLVTKISVDHAVMEKTDRSVVIPIDVGWNDLGSYQVLWSVSTKDGAGNVVRGKVVLSDVSGSYVHATSRSVAVAGIEDVVVVETADAVLVIPRHRAQEVRELAADFNPD